MEASDGLPTPRRYWSIVAIALGIIMAVLDGAIANVALPSIARDLNASPASSIWVVNAYQLAIVGSLLPFASLGDIVGYRRVFQAGLLTFTLASLACAMSGSLVALTLARILQGFGAAALMSVNAALVRFTYPNRLLGRAIGINALVVAVSSAVGPTVASAILSAAPWPWLFAVNLPMGTLALLIAHRALPHTEPSRQPFDLVSALLNALTFGLLIVGVESVMLHPLPGALALAGGLTTGVVLVRRQLSKTTPLVPIDLLRIPAFAFSVAASVCSFSAQMLALVSLPFYFQNVLGRTQVETGLLMTPWPVAVAVMAPIAGRLADRFSAAVLCGLGSVILSLGLTLLALLPATAPSGALICGMAICGVGFGFFQSPNNRSMLGSAPKSRSGGAGGMQATARLLGQTCGAALVAVIFRAASSHGSTVSLGVGACFAATAALVSTFRHHRQVDVQVAP
ncbi:MFS transporter [Vitiosangium sp. GDMCC 1.1324]|uniref:MFS transporter n=1 Tax=Vitiosangium sp. (strain GDMCC 1.1324) TaxID=2138576 RepID=UPI000D351F15|nr:MFS transporter [Vitiosangium sp. GDMCC 1.1324]PTL79037.1 MFS transporter [Vitiosangium sp. GDMCC 1.1324]